VQEWTRAKTTQVEICWLALTVNLTYMVFALAFHLKITIAGEQIPYI
jgi:hypothetical protein